MQVTIAEAKARLAEIIRRAEGGEDIVLRCRRLQSRAEQVVIEDDDVITAARISSRIVDVAAERNSACRKRLFVKPKRRVRRHNL